MHRSIAQQGLIGAVGWVVMAASLGLTAPAVSATPVGAPNPKIVNGFPGGLSYPAVGLFHTRTGSCSATLIGCSTALTAAQCVCTDPVTHQVLSGAQCLGRPDLLDPTDQFVFFPQAGLFAIVGISVHPAFVARQGSDLAVLRLATPVTGIAPVALDTTARPGLQSFGTIAGFGINEQASSGPGFRRFGDVTLKTCVAAGVNAANHLCATFAAPYGPLGSNAGPCVGDFGGPFLTYLTFDGPQVLAGVLSGGDSPTQNCLPENHLWFADVYKDRDWVIAAAGSDLGTSACGGVVPPGGPETSSTGGYFTLDSAHPSATFGIGTALPNARLRIAMAAEGYRDNDAILYVKRGSAPTPASYDCKSDLPGALAFCDVAHPAEASGDWYFRMDRVSGLGTSYEVDTELIAQPAPQPCVPSATTLCIDDRTGDRRFAVTADFETETAQGQGRALSLESVGVAQGGLFWFFAPENPELLVKVLNGCGLNDRFWIFLSGGTNVGVTLKIVDTANGHTYTKISPRGAVFPTIQDTEVGLPCS